MPGARVEGTRERSQKGKGIKKCLGVVGGFIILIEVMVSWVFTYVKP